MANKMLIDATHPEETRVVVVRGNRVEEFDFESAHRKQLRGNIYLAKVTRVEPSLQAAFVDYGGNRHGFLAFSEIHPDYYQIPVADRQALIAEDERAQRAEDDEADHRARRRHGSRQRSAQRSRDVVRGPQVEGGGAADAEHQAAESEDHGPPADLAEGTAVPAELILPATEDPSAEAEAVAGPLTADPEEDTAAEATLAAPAEAEVEQPESPEAAEAASEELAAAAHEPAPVHDAPFADEAPATDDETTAEDDAGAAEGATGEDAADTELAATSEAGNGSEPGSGNGLEESADEEEEVIESIGGADAMEEVPERMPRLRRQYKIQEVIKRKQVMLVQVVKEERGTKGAALTTYLSLAGRYSVLMPNTARGGGISRKITNATDRKRLKELAQDLEVPEGMGVILRTAGANRTKTEIKRDFEYLLRLWETVRDLTLKSNAPKLVYEEGSLVKRSIRDLYNKDIDEVIVAGDDGYRDAKDFMRMLMPSHAKNVKPYKDTQPLFTRFGVEHQLDAMFSPIVQLRSGGYIVLNQAEALVAIDVNSGRATREHHIEDTALKTNMEAAEEIARQLRLRDLAGLIVIDFIDMDEKRNNRSVERRLKECLKHDRARIQVGRISHFGLLEMSRQRIRTSVLESSTEKCPVCGGTGHVRSVSSVALQLLRSLEETLIKGATHNLIARTRSEVALYVLNHKRAHLRELEERFRVTVTVSADETVAGTQSFVVEKGEQVHTAETARALAIQPDTIVPISEGLEDEEEVADDAEEETAEAGEDDARDARAETESEEDGGRRRRRRRRRGRRPEEREGPGGPRETVAEHAVAHAEDFEPGSEDDGEAAPGDELSRGDAAEAEAEARPAEDGRDEARAGGNGERRRRRRGRRGGRRNRGPREEGDFAGAAAPGEAGAAFDDHEHEDHPHEDHPHEDHPHEDLSHQDHPHDAEATPVVAAPAVTGPATPELEPAPPQAEEPSPAPQSVLPEPSSTPPIHADAPPPAASPRRRSTVREPAPSLPNAGEDTPEASAGAGGEPTAAGGPDAEPAAAAAHPPAEPPPAVATSEDTDAAGKPRRTGWWARRMMGSKN
jgi:ribonuclease E